jgi:purine-binding chemotaxis protein CheW
MNDDKTLETPGFDWVEVRQRIMAGAATDGPETVTQERLEEVWARRAEALARPSVQEDGGEQLQVVVVRLGHELYGLEAQHIFTIRPAAQITRVPRVPNWVAGVVNLRGRILSVIDLRSLFGLAAREQDGKGGVAEAPCLVVVEMPEMEVALLVDEVLTVETLPAGQIQEATGAVRGLRTEYVRGVVERGERVGAGSADGSGSLLVLLDLLALLTDSRLIIHEEIV